MTGFEPIIYIISAIAAETIKDISKHLGKTAKETYDSLNEPILQLGLSDFENLEEIQQKLEANPEIKAEIEHKVSENQEAFRELLNFLKDNRKPIINKFKNQSNEKVINIGTHNGDIYAIENEPKAKNTVNQGNKQIVWAGVIVVSIVAIVGMFIFALSIKSETNNQNDNVNSIVNSPNSAINLKINADTSNISNISNNSNINFQNLNNTNRNKVTQPIKPSNSNYNKVKENKNLETNQSSNVIVNTDNPSNRSQPKVIPTANPCSSTYNGCNKSEMPNL